MSIPTTSTPQSGRATVITLAGTSGTITANCTGDVPLQPAMNEPSVSITPFQGGDAVVANVDGGYQTTNITCEYKSADYALLDTARANAIPWTVTLGSGGFSGSALVSVSQGPTLIVNGTSVPTMTLAVAWTKTATVTQ